MTTVDWCEYISDFRDNFLEEKQPCFILERAPALLVVESKGHRPCKHGSHGRHVSYVAGSTWCGDSWVWDKSSFSFYKPNRKKKKETTKNGRLVSDR